MCTKHYIVIIISLLFFSASADAEYYWERQQTPVTSDLHKCTFADSLYGWVCGNDGVILRTTNGGINWTIQNSPVDFFIYDIHFVDRKFGWAIANDNFANGTAVLYTTNSGDNWNMYRYPDKGYYFYSIYFLDSLTGFMGGYQGVFVKSTDGGLNWSYVPLDTAIGSALPVYDIKFFNKDLGVASGGLYDIAGVTWTTTNGGNFWKSQMVAAEPLFCVLFKNNSTVFASGGDFEFGAILQKSTNAGVNWNTDYLNVFGIARGISFRTENEGWMVLGFTPYILFTSNGGSNWESIVTTDSSELYDVKFVNERNGWAVGKRGVILKYQNSPIHINNLNETISSFELYQNFPNPFNGETNIDFEINKPGSAKIVVYDLLGKEIERINYKNLSAGKYSIRWQSNSASSGIYFYSLFFDNRSIIKKMLLLN